TTSSSATGRTSSRIEATRPLAERVTMQNERRGATGRGPVSTCNRAYTGRSRRSTRSGTPPGAVLHSGVMSTSMPPAPRGRRPRRGSVERPVDGRLYRGAFLVLSLPLLLAAFTIRQPTPLQAPVLPATFDAQATLQDAIELSQRYPDRRPGT